MTLETFYSTFWALVPAIVAIGLALITKEVYSSLFIGILVGGMFYSGFSFVGTMEHVFNDGMIASLALLFSFLLNNVTLKSIVGRPRPYDTIEGLTLLSTPEIDTSFPSGHTSCAVSVGLAILLAAKRKWPGIIMMAFAALMAFSRLYLGAHYPSDVLTAIVTATLMTFLALFVFRKLEKAWKDRHPEKPEEPPKEDPPPEEGMA